MGLMCWSQGTFVSMCVVVQIGQSRVSATNNISCFESGGGGTANCRFVGSGTVRDLHLMTFVPLEALRLEFGS